MQNNKIYMTLAHLYNQVKDTVGNSGRSLSEEINNRVDQSPEVITGRKGYPKLIDKIDAIDTSINGAGQEIMQVSNRINQTADEILRLDGEIAVIKDTSPVVELENGDSLLVEITKRPDHRTMEFSLKEGEQYRANADAEHYVSNLYVRDNVHNKEIDLSFDPDTSEYDKSRYDNLYGSLYGAYIGERYIPLNNIMTAKQTKYNTVIIPGIAQIQGITPVLNITEKNHVINAFVQGYRWIVKARRVEVQMVFDRPTYISQIDFDFVANTLQQSVSVFEYDGSKPVEFNKVPSIDGYIGINKIVKDITLVFDALSDDESTFVTIKNIAIKSRVYNNGGSLFNVSKQVDLYDLSGHATLGTILDFEPTSRNLYGISDSNDSPLITSYYPAKRVLRHTSFTNKFGNYACEPLKAVTLDSFILDSKLNDRGITGSESVITIGNTVTWEEDTSKILSGGYSINNLSYNNLQVVISNVEHNIALESVNLNKETIYDLDGVKVTVQLKVVNGGLKIKVHSSSIIQAVRLITHSMQNLYTNCDGKQVRSRDNSFTSTTYNELGRGYTFTSNYEAFKDHYNYNIQDEWILDHIVRSKYNQLVEHSIVMLDTNMVNGNPVKIITETSVQFDKYIFEITDTKSTVIYLGKNDNAFHMKNTDCEIVMADDTPKVSPLNEYVGVMRKHIRQKVSKITPQYTSDLQNDVQIYLSNNNYNFYTYNSVTQNWEQTKDGMSPQTLKGIPFYAYEQLFTSESVYIKVKLLGINAQVTGFDVEFDRNGYIQYPKEKVGEFGMTEEDMLMIDSDFLLNTINVHSNLSVFVMGHSKYPHEQYVCPGLQLAEYGGISWMLDTNKTASQHISGNMLIITNITKEVRYYKLIQKYFEDKYVQVGSKEENEHLKDLVKENEELKESIGDYKEKVAILDQNVQLLLEAMSNNEKPPTDLPTFIIPSQIEIDLPALMPGDSTEIKDMKELRYIQYWNTTTEPVPEAIESTTIANLKHYFDQENGSFTDGFYELDKYYDVDNIYLMTRGFMDITPSYFRTSEYVCTSKFQDGNPCNTVQNVGLDRISIIARNGNVYSTNQDYAAIYMAYFQLPGENRRWVDIDFEFIDFEYIDSLSEMDFNCGATYWFDNDRRYSSPTILNEAQQTVIFLDRKGDDNWVEHRRFTGIGTDVYCAIKQEIKKLRIRLEIPYSASRGTGFVSLKYLNINFCPVRYKHDEDAKIKPVLYYNTSTWQRFISTESNATISGTDTDVRYLIETNTTLQNDKKLWGFEDGVLVEKDEEIYSNGMTLYDFNNLSEEQLMPLLEYQYIRPIAILDSTDGHHSPRLRSMTMVYSEKETETVSLTNPSDVVTRYDKDRQSVIVTNATNAVQTLKAIIS